MCRSTCWTIFRPTGSRFRQQRSTSSPLRRHRSAGASRNCRWPFPCDSYRPIAVTHYCGSDLSRNRLERFVLYPRYSIAACPRALSAYQADTAISISYLLRPHDDRHCRKLTEHTDAPPYRPPIIEEDFEGAPHCDPARDQHTFSDDLRRGSGPKRIR